MRDIFCKAFNFLENMYWSFGRLVHELQNAKARKKINMLLNGMLNFAMRDLKNVKAQVLTGVFLLN